MAWRMFSVCMSVADSTYRTCAEQSEGRILSPSLRRSALEDVCIYSKWYLKEWMSQCMEDSRKIQEHK